MTQECVCVIEFILTAETMRLERIGATGETCSHFLKPSKGSNVRLRRPEENEVELVPSATATPGLGRNALKLRIRH